MAPILDCPEDRYESSRGVTSKPCSPSLVRLLAALAACVLALGLPRLLVACTNDDAGTHLEWRHAPGECCAHGHAALVPPERSPAGDVPSAGSHDSCEHVDLAIELAPMPRPEAPMAPPPALVAVLAPLRAATSAPRRAPFHVPATGPPRRDAPVSLHTTSLLRS